MLRDVGVRDEKGAEGVVETVRSLAEVLARNLNHYLRRAIDAEPTGIEAQMVVLVREP